MIRLAKKEEIDTILSLTQACAQHMIAQNIYQWNDTYPSRTAFEKDVERRELYVYILESKIIGTIVVSDDMDEEYKPISWKTPNTNNIYIHRLAVHPSYQGKGIAQAMMTFAENYAQKEGYISVRLDTFSQNKRNQKFYIRRGYVQLGNIYFPKQSEAPFYCYELVL